MEPRAQLSLVARPEPGSSPPAVPEKLWTVKQAAEWLSITEQSLRTMLKRRQIPAQAINRCLMQDFDAFASLAAFEADQLEQADLGNGIALVVAGHQ